MIAPEIIFSFIDAIFDEYINWFPHISPDGKWIALIPFPQTLIKNHSLAYSYGGQGGLTYHTGSLKVSI